jgi:hypothetical protein
MANPTVITIVDAQLVLSDTAITGPPFTGGDDFSCQVTSAAINSTPNLQDVPATFCAGASQAPAATGYELAVSWLQDWTASTGGLSMYAFDNDTLTKYFALTLDTTSTPIATGELRIVPGAFGGDAGTPLLADAVWPIIGKPAISAPALAAAATREPAAANA